MPAREPASSPTNLAPSPLLVALVGRKMTVVSQTSAFPSKTSLFKPVILAHRGLALPWLVEDRAAYLPERALPGSPRQCSQPLACRHPPEGHKFGARKRRAPGYTILSQPYRRRVSTDRLNREGSQLATSLEGESGPTPAGNTLPHSYLETRFRSERARN